MMSFAQLESFIFEKIAETKLPGLSAALVKDGAVVWSKGFGFRDVEKGLAATPHSLYSVGSVTKSFTTLAIMQLAAQGKLAIDDPIDKYMAFEIRPGSESVRIWHLMTHTSGLPALAYAENTIGGAIGALESWFPIATADDILTFMRDSQNWAVTKPGERWFYLNEGYMLLGAIIEKVSMLRYEDYVRQYILKPLGMKRSFYDNPDVEGDQDVATPYVNWAEAGRLASKYPYGGLAPAGGLISSVLDLANYLMMYLNGGALNGERLLVSSEINVMTTPRIATPPKNTAFGDEGYGYGWGTKANFLGHKLVGHGGSIGIATAYIGFIPDQNVGVAILTNGSGYATGQLGMYGLALLLGEDPEALPFVRRQRLTAGLEGVYETYKGTMKWQVKRVGDFIMVSQTDKFGSNSFPLIPDILESERRLFYTLDSGNRIEAEFKINGDQIDMIYERYLLRRTGRLSPS
jgi:CubicO group peptidase (beta-lactamase class C family)